MYTGLADQEALAQTDFLTNPRALVGVVLDGVKGGDARVKLLGEIAARYMETYLDAAPPKLPLTPHHTQARTPSPAPSPAPSPSPSPTPTPTPSRSPTPTRTANRTLPLPLALPLAVALPLPVALTLTQRSP